MVQMLECTRQNGGIQTIRKSYVFGKNYEKIMVQNKWDTKKVKARAIPIKLF